MPTGGDGFLLPRTDKETEGFWEGTAAGELRLQACGSCAILRFPPRVMCPHCQSLAWEPLEAAGRGTVAAWIVSKHPSQPDDNPRLVALIALEEGLRMISNLREVEEADVRLDMPVEVFFAEIGGAVLPQFRPAARV